MPLPDPTIPILFLLGTGDRADVGRLDVAVILKKNVAAYHNCMTLFLLLHFFLLMVIGNLLLRCLLLLVEIAHDDNHGDCDYGCACDYADYEFGV